MKFAKSNNVDNCGASKIEPSSLGPATSALARKSTGPLTRLGKERSRTNALTHGIFSKAVVLKNESQGEFDVLLDGLRKDFRPVGRLEETLVELPAVTWWRQRRLLIAETAEIEERIEIVKSVEREDTFGQTLMAARRRLREEPILKIGDPNVLQMCLDLLRNLKLEIETNGVNQENDKNVLTKIYGDSSEGFQLKDLFDDCVKDPMVVQSKDGVFSPEESKHEFLKGLENEIERLCRYPGQQAARESNRMRQMNLESRRRGIPGSPRLNQLLRYWTTLERTFDRTLSQLERAQPVRLGHPVPPSINVSVSS
jgi:hypothetical protein